IVRAARKLVEEYRDNGRDVSEIDEAVFNSHLDTHGLPDPDLLIRTSGEMRLSNYLLWQLAYTELYVTDCLWPDFNKEELEKAVVAYNGRERRFGGRK
ncbi:MAG: polyprenyl diphosphate synthase, partial [Hungatella hathewayi]